MESRTKAKLISNLSLSFERSDWRTMVVYKVCWMCDKTGRTGNIMVPDPREEIDVSGRDPLEMWLIITNHPKLMPPKENRFTNNSNYRNIYI